MHSRSQSALQLLNKTGKAELYDIKLKLSQLAIYWMTNTMVLNWDGTISMTALENFVFEVFEFTDEELRPMI